MNTDPTWKVTNEDKEWIDESGKASDTSATVYAPAGYWNFDDIATPPSAFSLKLEPMNYVAVGKRLPTVADSMISAKRHLAVWC